MSFVYDPWVVQQRCVRNYALTVQPKSSGAARKKQATSFRLVYKAVSSLSRTYSHIRVYRTTVEERRGVYTFAFSERGGEESTDNRKQRNIFLTEARKIKIIMEVRFLMTGSWRPTICSSESGTGSDGR
jgi:hypothetical protein